MLENLRILLVEDDAADRALIAALLRQGLSSARIQEVNGALEFAEMLDGHRWSVTIAGDCLSWANGAELLRTVKQHHPECRTILFGRAPPEGLGTFGPGTGLDAYLRKDSTGFLELPALIREAVSTSTQATAERTYPLLRGGIEAAPIGYFWVLSDGTLLETNPAFGALVGETDPEALIGRSLLGWVNGTASRTRIERSLLRGTREDLTDVPLRVAGSIERRCNLSFWPVADDLGRPCLEGMLWDPGQPPTQPVDVTIDTSVPTSPDETFPSPQIDDDASPTPSSGLLSAGTADDESLNDRKAEPGSGRVVPLYDGVPAKQASAQQPEASSVPSSGGNPDLALELNVRPESLERVPIKNAVLGAMEKLRPLISATHAQFRSGPLPTVLANRSEMERLFRELFENSLEARAQTPPQITIQAEKRVDGWLLSVKDNGIGFSEEDQRALFQPGGDNVSQHPGKGLGICQRIAKRYRGDIWLTSESGKGTTFFVMLKATVVPEGAASLSIQLNGEAMGEVAVTNKSSKREIAQAALALPELKHRIGKLSIKYVQFVDSGVVNIVA